MNNGELVPSGGRGMSSIDRVIRFCLENKLIVGLGTLLVVAWGIMVAPFDWNLGGVSRAPVAVDAIPDIGENQQIVFTEWMGRSPQDVEDQITYPLTVALLGIPGVKTVRSSSMFGFSSIYVIFDEKAEFYWSRERVLERLSSLPPGSLPEGVRPTLGPDATALGQVFWYTLEGRDPEGKPAGGWDLADLRRVQDWQVRFALMSAEGTSEVASVGGFVQEYQVDVDPDAMRAHGVTLEQIVAAVKNSNLDVGARTVEINRVEYVIRGLGFIKSVGDIEKAVVKVSDNVPILVKDVAVVAVGPALRRGALDKEGAEAVGGIVVVRYGYNPLKAIGNVKAKISEIAPSLPVKALVDLRKVSRSEVESFGEAHGFAAFKDGRVNQEEWLKWLRSHPGKEWPSWVTTSRMTIVPFYDRTGLIYETLGTLSSALADEILVTIIVVVVAVLHLRSSALISAVLPLAVLISFIAMKTFGVDANIVALSGIAIAIGTVVDMGIVVCENILKHLDRASPDENPLEVVFRASSEVGSAVLTAVSTTVVSFLPVFTMTGPEGKLFKPLAFTKTFALVASVVVALTIIPAGAHILFTRRPTSSKARTFILSALVAAGAVIAIGVVWWAGVIVAALGACQLLAGRFALMRKAGAGIATAAAVLFVGILLTSRWLPIGPEKGYLRNLVFVAGVIGGLLVFFRIFQHFYGRILRWCLAHKLAFLSIPALLTVLGAVTWLGFDRVFGFIPAATERIGVGGTRVRQTSAWRAAYHTFPGLGREFMPPLDEGSFLYMPTTMAHASIGEVLDVLQKMDTAFAGIPEIESVVGKLGRAETPLDPAPISMIETVINYKPEYVTDKDGHRVRFAYDEKLGTYVRDQNGELVPDPKGRPYRQWREHIKSPEDIWREIVRAGEIPGTTSAPLLQPISTRIVMLQSGMRAPMGVKVRGPDLETIEQVCLDIERLLKEVPGVEPSTVIADRIVGKPYLEIDIDRNEISRHGLSIKRVQDVIQAAVGGAVVTTTVEGRERYPVRVRYMRELRDQIDTLGRVLVAAPNGSQIPLIQLAEIQYVRGPQVIKSEDTFLIGYVLFDKKPDHAEVDVVENSQKYLQEKRASGEFTVPSGVSYVFAGTYENQVRSQKKLALVLPAALFVIFSILCLHFRSAITATLVFSGIVVAWAGGFILVWLYGQPWFLDFHFFGINMRELFQVHPINLSVAIWVGFLALFGIASDNGVVIATYLDQTFAGRRVLSVSEVREATVAGAVRRIRPCLMTSATTILALLPVLTSTGRGSDVMIPMAIPSFGGMLVVLVSVFVVPVLYCWVRERQLGLVQPRGKVTSD